jgi:predicted transcriptional regulator
MSETSVTRERLPVGERRELFREVRKTCDVTLAQLGEMADVSYPMLSLFESGERDLSAEAWGRVADAMEKLLIEANKKRDAEIASLKNEQSELQKKAGQLGIVPTSLISTQHPDYSPENLKNMRKALGMTQAELAKRAGVTQALVSAFENGVKDTAAQHTRARIANALVLAEHQQLIEMCATPKTETEKLNQRIAWLEKELKIAHDYIKGVEEEKKELLGMVGWRTKKTVEDDEQREAEKKLMDKIGAEKIPSVEEEALRAEIAQHSRPKGRKEK